MAGKFELRKGASGDIAASEAYESKATSLNGIESVRNNPPDAVLDGQTD